MTVLLPANQPSYGISVKTSYRTLVNNFGDGYSQTVPDGLNSKMETWDLTWEMNQVDADDLEAQLSVLAGQTFEWETPRGDTKSFTCKEFQKIFTSFDNFKITAQFQESFVV